MPSSHDTVDDPRNAAIRVWMNGRLVPKEEAVVSVLDAGFLLELEPEVMHFHVSG